MPSNFNYTVAIAYVAESNNTLIAKREVKFKDCSVWNIPENCGLWNNQKCGSDQDYCQPFLEGDKIFGQVVMPASYAGFAALQVFDSATGNEVVMPAGGIVTQIGKDPDGIRYLNYVIDTSLLPAGTRCWFLRMTMWECRQEIKPSQAFINCVEAKVQDDVPLQQAILECGNERCPDNSVIHTSEPFCLVDCAQVSTILIEGVYAKFDCDGFYYGPMTNLAGNPMANIYQLSVRVFGEVEANGHIYARTTQGGILTKIARSKSFVVYFDIIPPYVADVLGRVFGGKTVTIDGAEYLPPDRIDKNFEEGRSWLPKLAVTQECAEQDLTCE
jgi:hypothetical protein